MPTLQCKRIAWSKKSGSGAKFWRANDEKSNRTALNDLKNMVRKRILTREGKTKSAVYRIPK